MGVLVDKVDVSQQCALATKATLDWKEHCQQNEGRSSWDQTLGKEIALNIICTFYNPSGP